MGDVIAHLGEAHEAVERHGRGAEVGRLGEGNAEGVIGQLEAGDVDRVLSEHAGDFTRAVAARVSPLYVSAMAHVTSNCVFEPTKVEDVSDPMAWCDPQRAPQLVEAAHRSALPESCSPLALAHGSARRTMRILNGLGGVPI